MAKTYVQIQGETTYLTFENTEMSVLCGLMRAVLPMKHYFEHEIEEHSVVIFMPIDPDGYDARKQINLMGVK